MPQIPLTRGQIALVDKADYELLCQYKWQAIPAVHGFYATAAIKMNGRWTTVQMHRLIMAATAGQMIDHKNGNPLDNRKHNLRLCTHSQNNANQRGKRHTRYKGVCRCGNRWKARIGWQKKVFQVGMFETEVEAAEAYNLAARRVHGEFARLNQLPVQRQSLLRME